MYRVIPSSESAGVGGFWLLTPLITLNWPFGSKNTLSVLGKKNWKSEMMLEEIFGISIASAPVPVKFAPESSTRGLKSRTSLNSNLAPVAVLYDGMSSYETAPSYESTEK